MSQRTVHVARRSLLFLVLSFLFASFGLMDPAAAHDRKIRTDRQSQQELPLPEGDEVFHFVIFGDRTGGPPEGIEVLAQAVEDTNLLDPDLVLTVGDLIEGYNQTEKWMVQMREFRSTMEKLEMPWFPVAGNHDIYWRGSNKPEGEHEKSYEKHFGPLWYWFEHKDVGFLVLYTDEGHAETGQKAFGREGCDNFSPRQLAWLDGALKEMAKLDQVFVFLHHPRWLKRNYSENNWEVVHGKLAATGNVSAVFAGHIHRMNYDGARDGIEYYALATTGGHVLGDYPDLGFMHHLNMVTVREKGFTVAALPVGQVIDPKRFDTEYRREVDRARGVAPRLTSGPLVRGHGGEVAGLVTVEIHNPTAGKLDISLTPEAGADRWVFYPDHRHGSVEAGATQEFEFAVAREPGEKFVTPRLEYAAEYVAGGGRMRLPPKSVGLPIELRPAPESFFRGGHEGALVLSKEGDAVAVASRNCQVPDGPLTLEARVSPSTHPARAGVVAKTEMSEFGIFMNSGIVDFSVFLGDAYASVSSKEKLEIGRTTHVAGVFDGEELRLYLDGKLVSRKAARGQRKRNRHPFYIGADTSGSGQPVSTFPGKIQEVRLSKVARYQGESFEPARRHEPDGDTILLFHLARASRGFVFDHASRRGLGTLRGQARVITTSQGR